MQTSIDKQQTLNVQFFLTDPMTVFFFAYYWWLSLFSYQNIIKQDKRWSELMSENFLRNGLYHLHHYLAIINHIINIFCKISFTCAFQANVASWQRLRLNTAILMCTNDALLNQSNDSCHYKCVNKMSHFNSIN